MKMTYKSGMVTISRSQLDQIRQDAYNEGLKVNIEPYKQEIFEKAIHAVLENNDESLEEVHDASLYLVLITGNKALKDMGCDRDFLMEYCEMVANITSQINTGESEAEDVEKELADFGIKLIKEEK